MAKFETEFDIGEEVNHTMLKDFTGKIKSVKFCDSGNIVYEVYWEDGISPHYDFELERVTP